jgi:hypothetical protein
MHNKVIRFVQLMLPIELLYTVFAIVPAYRDRCACRLVSSAWRDAMVLLNARPDDWYRHLAIRVERGEDRGDGFCQEVWTLEGADERGPRWDLSFPRPPLTSSDHRGTLLRISCDASLTIDLVWYMPQKVGWGDVVRFAGSHFPAEGATFGDPQVILRCLSGDECHAFQWTRFILAAERGIRVQGDPRRLWLRDGRVQPSSLAANVGDWLQSIAAFRPPPPSSWLGRALALVGIDARMDGWRAAAAVYDVARMHRAVAFPPFVARLLTLQQEWLNKTIIS